MTIFASITAFIITFGIKILSVFITMFSYHHSSHDRSTQHIERQIIHGRIDPERHAPVGKSGERQEEPLKPSAQPPPKRPKYQPTDHDPEKHAPVGDRKEK